MKCYVMEEGYIGTIEPPFDDEVHIRSNFWPFYATVRHWKIDGREYVTVAGYGKSTRYHSMVLEEQNPHVKIIETKDIKRYLEDHREILRYDWIETWRKWLDEIEDPLVLCESPGRYRFESASHRDVVRLLKQVIDRRVCEIDTYVFLDEDASDNNKVLVKIGVSVDVSKRLKSVETASGRTLHIVRVFRFDIEKRLHLLFGRFRGKGEWFLLPRNVYNILAKETMRKGFDYFEIMAKREIGERDEEEVAS